MKAVLYARVSKIDAGDPKSIPTQKADCRAVAEDVGAEIVGTFIDPGRSGWDRRVRREQYEAMLAMIAADGIDVVITQDVDRLFRQDVERKRFDDVTKAVRMDRIQFTDGSSIDLSTAKGRESFRDAASKAEFYADRLSEKVQRKHRRIAADGLPNGGGRPFGYDRITDPAGTDEDGTPVFHKTLSVNEVEAEAIRTACASLLDGDTLRGVTRRWNTDGLRTTAGNVWQPKAVRTVLLSGRIVGLRDITAKDPRTGERSRLKSEPADWAPIVATDVQAKVRARLADATRGGRYPERTGRNTSGGKHLLSGLLVCATCGRGLVCQPQRGRPTYTCLSPAKHPAGARPRIDGTKAEAYVIGATDGLREPTTTVADPAKVSQELRDREAATQERMARLAEMVAKDAMSIEQFEVVNRPLVEELAAVRAERDAAAAPVVTTWQDIYGGPSDLNDPAEVRSWLDRLVIRAVLKPSGRSKWTTPADRIDITWREGVRDTWTRPRKPRRKKTGPRNDLAGRSTTRFSP